MSPPFLLLGVNMYRSVYGESEAKIVIERSEFIAHITRAESEEEAVGFIEKIRSQNRRARHNCYAYRLKNENISRYSDDGEPSGTAGASILDVLTKKGLTDTVIVVTRYFGGILLGKGGLTRAYSQSAALAAQEARIMELSPAYIISLIFDYQYYDRIIHSLPKNGLKILSTDYLQSVSLSLAVDCELRQELEKSLLDLTNGRIVIEEIDKKLFDFSE